MREVGLVLFLIFAEKLSARLNVVLSYKGFYPYLPIKILPIVRGYLKCLPNPNPNPKLQVSSECQKISFLKKKL